jgi:type I pantothenate kinase
VRPDPALTEVVDRVPGDASRPVVVAVTGAVAVGKSAVAGDLAAALRDRGDEVAVVSTDGFLYPNAELEARGLLFQKGVPASHDLDRLEAVLGAIRSGAGRVEVPVYSHDRYDVDAEPRVVDRPDVLVLEGVVALQRPVADLGIYVDADHQDVERWYVERFQALVAAAEDDPGSFYAVWAGQSPEAVADVAQAVWAGVNLPNLLEHIEPTRDRADVVLVKGPDHAIREVRWQ